MLFMEINNFTILPYSITRYYILPGSIHGYSKFPVENSMATNRDCYAKIVHKVFIYGFQLICTQ